MTFPSSNSNFQTSVLRLQVSNSNSVWKHSNGVVGNVQNLVGEIQNA